VVTGFKAQFEPAMRLALAQAAAADPAPAEPRAATTPTTPTATSDVPVGAVVVDGNGHVIGSGRNRREADADPTAHAEIIALRAAGRRLGTWRLEGCALVVTLEPCTMCAGAVLAARLPRLVYGAADERAGAAGSVWDVLHDRRLGPPVEVITGVLAQECAVLLSDFFSGRRDGPPRQSGTGRPGAPGLG
jgi:tRNA(adenine34) deaminase